MTSIEGHRGEPRPRPPFPAVKGLFGKPTILNNVETYANIRADYHASGADWFSTHGHSHIEGHQGIRARRQDQRMSDLLRCRWEQRSARSLRRSAEASRTERSSRPPRRADPRADVYRHRHMDTPIDYDNLIAIGSMMGSGGLIVMDEDTCMVDIAKFFLEFTVDESCGKCAPCRIGTSKTLSVHRQGDDPATAELEDLDKTRGALRRYMKSPHRSARLGQIAPRTPCFQRCTTSEDEYIAHVKDKTCPSGVCKDLLTYRILPDKCKGCTLCARNCPVDAIIRQAPKKPHVIDRNKCIKCGALYAQRVSLMLFR